MQEPDKMQGTPRASRRFTKGWLIVLTICLVVALLLAGVAYTQRHQIRQFIQELREPPAQTVHITPLTLPSVTTTTTPVQVTATDWTTYHGDNMRSGFVAKMPDPTAFANLWKQTLDGAVYAEPLVVGEQLIVVTENDTVYSLNAQTGQIEWHTSVGTPVPLSDLPCGNIDPLGITGTPVYDPQTGLVFAVAEIQGPAHILLGLDVKTGQIKVRRLVDPSSIDPRAYQQRAALALYAGKVYIAFGGLYGDCGNYRGMVVASRTDGTGSLLIYQVPTTRMGGIWEPAGPIVDAQGNLYVSVGNGDATGGSWDHTDSVLKLSPSLLLEDAFAPQSWPQDNANDLDLGSLGPVFLPGGFIFIQGKSNNGYLLHANHLGGIGGQIQTISVCAAGAYGGAAVNGLVAFIPCTDGLREIQLGSGGNLLSGWQASGQVTGSPVIGGNTVYTLDPGGGTLYALDTAKGSVRATISVGTTSRFATPTLFQNTIFVGTMTGIVAVQVRT
jgi:outer membrane protein assembly factor BamB